MTEENAGNGHVYSITRRRVHQVTLPAFGPEPALRDVVVAIANVATAVEHNFQAVVEEVEDVRADIRVRGGELSGRLDRIEAMLKELTLAIVPASNA